MFCKSFKWKWFDWLNVVIQYGKYKLLQQVIIVIVFLLSENINSLIKSMVTSGTYSERFCRVLSCNRSIVLESEGWLSALGVIFELLA